MLKKHEIFYAYYMLLILKKNYIYIYISYNFMY